jgi:hypothetical protein
VSAKAIIAVVFWTAIVAAVGVIWIRERGSQRRLTESVARSVSAKLQGSLTQVAGQWRIDALYEGRPVVLVLGGKFLARGGDMDSGSDFAPTLDIKTPCATTAQVIIHYNFLPGAAGYTRDLWAKARGSKVTTGATDFDSRFLAESPVPSDVAILDDRIRERMLLSQSAVHGRSLAGHSWSIRVGDGSVESHEVFDDGSQPVPATEIASETMSRLGLLCALAASAEQRKPSGLPATP